MAWNPMVLIKAAENAGVKFDVDDTWLDVNPYGSGFNPVGVVWHHTATGTFSKGDMPSLSWCRFPGQYSMQARACHILVARSGHMQIIAGKGAYHAGEGGPLKVNGKLIPEDMGNQFLIGIEIEASSSTKVNKKNRITPKSGLNPIQLEATARYNAALFDLMKWPTTSAIRHRDWAPNRKIDVGIPLEDIHTEIDRYRIKSPVLPKPQTVRLMNVKLNKKNDDILLVQEALKKEFPHSSLVPNGFFNNNTKLAYKKWQEKLGFTGDDADGLPGVDSLTKLGRKYGFTVKR